MNTYVILVVVSILFSLLVIAYRAGKKIQQNKQLKEDVRSLNNANKIRKNNSSLTRTQLLDKLHSLRK